MAHTGAPLPSPSKLPSSSSQNGAIVATVPSQISNNVVYHDAKSGHLSPNLMINQNNHSTDAINSNGAANSLPLNEKAEAFAQAHRLRVEAEANAYRDAQSRKVEARAHKNLVSGL
jgi:hypothetical protein